MVTTDTNRIHIMQYRNVWRFVIWRFSAKSPIRQIKNLAKFSRYMVYCTAFFLPLGLGGGGQVWRESFPLPPSPPCSHLHNSFFFVSSISWVQLNGAMYKHGNIVVLSMDDVPTFGVIEDIIVLQTDVYYLVCSLLVTECFSHHFHAFQVHKVQPTEYIISEPSTLHDTHVLGAYAIPSNPTAMYIPLKYQLMEQ